MEASPMVLLRLERELANVEVPRWIIPGDGYDGGKYLG